MSFISRHVNSKMVAYAIVAFVVAYILHTFFPALVSLGRFIVSVLSPFLIAVILYYLFRPLVNLLRKRLSIYGAIIVSFIVLFGFMTFVIVFIYPAIVDQVDVLKQANLEHISSEGQDGETLLQKFYL
jgi:predicted PurR-regulated permease PerM